VLEHRTADKAGLQTDDILLKINDKQVNTEAELFEILGQHRPGETVSLTFSRKGKILNADAILQDANGETTKRDVKIW
jgi:S1-C subfamily serine protease